ncbi:maleylpyruvate isomerase N-terminal domain-containing protein [Streptomyces canus]
MSDTDVSEAAKAVIRRNTEDVQGEGNYELYDELFSGDFLDHTPQPGRTGLSKPSALPGWTHKRVVSHVGFNARAAGRLVHWRERAR